MTSESAESGGLKAGGTANCGGCGVAAGCVGTTSASGRAAGGKLAESPRPLSTAEASAEDAPQEVVAPGVRRMLGESVSSGGGMELDAAPAPMCVGGGGWVGGCLHAGTAPARSVACHRFKGKDKLGYYSPSA